MGCLRHHRGIEPVEERHRHGGFVSTFAAAQTAIIAGAGISYPFDTVRRRLQMQAEKPVEQHIYKGTVDCLRRSPQRRALPLASTRVSSPTRSAVSAEPWCWCSTTEPRTTWAWAARVVANEISRPDSFACFFQFDAPTGGSKAVRSQKK